MAERIKSRGPADMGARVAKLREEARLAKQGVHRVRLRNPVTGQIESAWYGVERPGDMGARAAKLREEARLAKRGIHRIRRRNPVTGQVESAWCGVDAPCSCADRTGTKVSRWRAGA